jgi:hypothetical protein
MSTSWTARAPRESRGVVGSGAVLLIGPTLPAPIKCLSKEGGEVQCRSHASVPERSKGTACKAVKSRVQIPPGAPTPWGRSKFHDPKIMHKNGVVNSASSIDVGKPSRVAVDE